MTDERRYRLIAYVGTGGSVIRGHNLGSQTFHEIWANAPELHRYIVIQDHNGHFLVTDLHDAVYDDATFVNMGAADIFSDADQAVAATAMNYAMLLATQRVRLTTGIRAVLAKRFRFDR